MPEAPTVTSYVIVSPGSALPSGVAESSQESVFVAVTLGAAGCAPTGTAAFLDEPFVAAGPALAGAAATGAMGDMSIMNETRRAVYALTELGRETGDSEDMGVTPQE
jgi:hypothetical protein